MTVTLAPPASPDDAFEESYDDFMLGFQDSVTTLFLSDEQFLKTGEVGDELITSFSDLVKNSNRAFTEKEVEMLEREKERVRAIRRRISESRRFQPDFAGFPLSPHSPPKEYGKSKTLNLSDRNKTSLLQTLGQCLDGWTQDELQLSLTDQMKQRGRDYLDQKKNMEKIKEQERSRSPRSKRRLSLSMRGPRTRSLSRSSRSSVPSLSTQDSLLRNSERGRGESRKEDSRQKPSRSKSPRKKDGYSKLGSREKNTEATGNAETGTKSKSSSKRGSDARNNTQDKKTSPENGVLSSRSPSKNQRRGERLSRPHSPPRSQIQRDSKNTTPRSPSNKTRSRTGSPTRLRSSASPSKSRPRPGSPSKSRPRTDSPTKSRPRSPTKLRNSSDQQRAHSPPRSPTKSRRKSTPSSPVRERPKSPTRQKRRSETGAPTTGNVGSPSKESSSRKKESSSRAVHRSPSPRRRKPGLAESKLFTQSCPVTRRNLTSTSLGSALENHSRANAKDFLDATSHTSASGYTALTTETGSHKPTKKSEKMRKPNHKAKASDRKVSFSSCTVNHSPSPCKRKLEEGALLVQSCSSSRKKMSSTLLGSALRRHDKVMAGDLLDSTSHVQTTELGPPEPTKRHTRQRVPSNKAKAADDSGIDGHGGRRENRNRKKKEVEDRRSLSPFRRKAGLDESKLLVQSCSASRKKLMSTSLGAALRGHDKVMAGDLLDATSHTSASSYTLKTTESGSCEPIKRPTRRQVPNNKGKFFDDWGIGGGRRENGNRKKKEGEDRRNLREGLPSIDEAEPVKRELF